MASNIKISTAARDAMIAAIAALVDGGAGAGKVLIRTGAPPTNVADADSGTLLATVVCSDPAFGAPATGVVTAANFTPDSSADASGDAGHFRIKDSDDVVIVQGTAGEAADAPDMTFDEKSIVATGVVDITALTMTMPIQ